MPVVARHMSAEWVCRQAAGQAAAAEDKPYLLDLSDPFISKRGWRSVLKA